MKKKKTGNRVKQSLPSSLTAPLFVPDFDLLEHQKRLPTSAEIAALAATLDQILPPGDTKSRSWEEQARAQSLEQRI